MMIHHDIETLLIWLRENRDGGENAERPLHLRHFALKFEKDLTTIYQQVRELEERDLPPCKRTATAMVTEGNLVRIPDWRFSPLYRRPTQPKKEET